MKLPTTPSFRLDNKNALITGSSSGIGLGCAVALAEAGASVVLAARRKEPLEELKNKLIEKGHQAAILELDITDTKKVETILNDQPTFDILVNSSGMAKHTPTIETTEEDFNSVIDVNLKGAYFITKEVAKKLAAPDFILFPLYHPSPRVTNWIRPLTQQKKDFKKIPQQGKNNS